MEFIYMYIKAFFLSIMLEQGQNARYNRINIMINIVQNCIHYNVKFKLTVNRYIDNAVIINVHLLATEMCPMEQKIVQFWYINRN